MILIYDELKIINIIESYIWNKSNSFDSFSSNSNPYSKLSSIIKIFEYLSFKWFFFLNFLWYLYFHLFFPKFLLIYLLYYYIVYTIQNFHNLCKLASFQYHEKKFFWFIYPNIKIFYQITPLFKWIEKLFNAFFNQWIDSILSIL